jgi:PAS domain S-box-containing protein
LKYFDISNNNSADFKLVDVFQLLTYRQKFEAVTLDFKKAAGDAQESETKFKTYTVQSPIAIYTTNQNGDCIYANETWLGMTGMTLEEALGKGWIDALHPDDLKHTQEQWYKSVQSKGKWSYEYRFVDKQQNITWVEGSAKELFNSKNELIGYLGSNVNITERKRVEHDLIIAKEKAEESDRLKSAFLANMSHEIRTPMNGILGFTDLLKKVDLSGQNQQKYVQIIEKSGNRLLNIINDIVSVSKIESGLMNTNLQESNINEQVNQVYNFFKLECESKGLQFKLNNVVTPYQAVIITDHEKVFAILTNLIKNAIKYTEKGSIEVGCSFNNNISALEFYIKDTGFGIPLNRQKAIFERFIQADITDKMALQGAGLGLSISKSYVELLGGKIWVESQESIGSKFYFTIPCDLKRDTPLILPRTVVEKEKSIPKLKILIVEDDEASEALISLFIKEFGIETLIARNGKQAVEICRNNDDINLILMDIQMPEMNGHEATRQIRQFNKDVIIIAQTAYSLLGDDQKAIQSGCNDYISKPIIKSKLIELVQKHFNN